MPDCSKHYLGTVGVVEESEYDLGEGVSGLLRMRRWRDAGQVVLQGFTQHSIEGQIGSREMILSPLVAAKLADLRPQAVEILKQ